MLKISLLILSTVFLVACQQSPGKACLDSFKSTFNDPESGKMISFDGRTLVYTATNKFGARIQSKAICVKTTDDKWERSRFEEIIMITNIKHKKIDIYHKCVEAGVFEASCFSGSSVLKAQHKISTIETDLVFDLLESEIKSELGFN